MIWPTSCRPPIWSPSTNARTRCWRTFGTTQRTRPMTSFSRGDVVLVKFVFADEQGAKQRPGLIISTDKYHQGRRETILAAITSNVGRLLVGDYKIKAWRKSGLLYPSIVTGIVRTIKHDMIASKIGELPASELHSVEDKLREILEIGRAHV